MENSESSRAAGRQAILLNHLRSVRIAELGLFRIPDPRNPVISLFENVTLQVNPTLQEAPLQVRGFLRCEPVVTKVAIAVASLQV